MSLSSKLLVGLLLLASLAAPAAAVSVANEDVTSDAQVDSQVTATVSLDELYRNPQYEQWTVAGSTDLEAVTWTVTYYDQTGAKVDQQSFDGQNFTGATVAADDGIASVDVEVTGTVPGIENYTYDPAPSFTVLALNQTREGGTSNEIQSWSATHYTSESRDARDALDAADTAVAAAGNPDAATTKFKQSVDAYENENFELASELAAEAEQNATDVQQSEERNQLLLYAGAGVVVLGLLVGGVFWYRSQQQTYDKLG